MNTVRTDRLSRASMHLWVVTLCGALTSLAPGGCKSDVRGDTAPPTAPTTPQTPNDPGTSGTASRTYPELPPPGEPKPVNFPAIESFTLDNELTVYVVENHEVPVVSSQLVIRAGTMDREHVAEFAATMLGEGTKSRTKANIDEAIEFVGGSLGGGAGTHVSWVQSWVLERDLKLALTLMADEVMNPAFPEPALKKLKAQEKTNLSFGKSQPGYLANVLFDQVAYPEDHPYGRPLPTEADIENITLDEVKKFHETFYRSNNAFLILSGDITVKAAKPLVQRTFGRWKAVDASKLPPNPLNEFKKYDLPKEVVIHLVDRPASAQTEIIIGNLALARNHPDWVSLQVANGILGDDATGRLFMDIREERGLTYNINSTVSEAQAPGTFSIVTRTRTKSTGEMLAATFEHLGKIRAEAPTPEEVATVSNKMIGAFPLGLETPQQIAGKVREVLIYNLPEDYWRDYRDEIAEVTPKSVHEAARKYIHPVPHVVLVGKAKAIEKQVREVLPKAKIIKYNADLQPVK